MKVHVNGIDLAYRDAGAGPVVILLHAFPLSSEMWHLQIEALKGRSLLIVPDLRGFGGSGALPHATSLDEMARDVVALLDHLRVDRFILGGLSMGGYIAFAALRQIDRGRVAGLILADTRAGADDEAGRRSREMMAREVEERGSGAVADVMPGRLLGPASLQARPDLAERVREMIRANSPAGIAAAQRAMAARADSMDLLPQLSMPALVIVGEDDALTPPAEAEKMAAALPDARLATIPGAGHLSNLEQPDAFNRHLMDFMDRLATRG